MSDWNPLELRKWKPRQPSPELRARIFSAAVAVQADGGAAAVRFTLGDFTRWIVPAFGCFLLVMATLSNHVHLRYIDLRETELLLPPLSEGHAAQLPAKTTKHSVMNSFPAKTIEWNYRPRTAATAMGTILISYTNKLIQ